MLRDIAMNIYYTESISTGGLNTFLGALRGGARHYFIIEEGGKQKCEQHRHKILYWPKNKQKYKCIEPQLFFKSIS